jgi:hypothetical protein
VGLGVEDGAWASAFDITNPLTVAKTTSVLVMINPPI